MLITRLTKDIMHTPQTFGTGGYVLLGINAKRPVYPVLRLYNLRRSTALKTH
jgi:hypothetical protein